MIEVTDVGLFNNMILARYIVYIFYRVAFLLTHSLYSSTNGFFVA